MFQNILRPQQLSLQNPITKKLFAPHVHAWGKISGVDDFDLELVVLDIFQSGKEKTNKHKHFGRDGVRDKHEPGTNGTPPWDKLGPVPGTNRPFSV